MQEDIDIQLWAYIDGDCSPEDSARIAHLIATDAEWKQQYEELIQFNNTLATDLQTHEAPATLADNVMREVSPRKRSAYSKVLNWGIRGVAAFFIVAVVATLVPLLADIEWSSANNSISPDWNLHFTLPQLPTGDYAIVLAFAVAILLLVAADMLFRQRARQV